MSARARSGTANKLAIAGVVLAVVMGLVVVLGMFVPPFKSYARDLFGLDKEPTISDFDDQHIVRSPDGRVQLGLPGEMSKAQTPVTFKTVAGDAKNVNGGLKGVSALHDPVDIVAGKGVTLPFKKVVVSFTYDPATLAQRNIDPASLGIAIYDTNLRAWVVLYSATVDQRTHTVSAVAPHFSKFTDVFLDAGKAATDIAVAGVGLVKTAYHQGMSIVEWTKNFMAQTTRELIQDLTGTADALHCKQNSTTIKVSKVGPDGALKFLSGCFEDTSGSDKRLRLRNGYAFPLLSDKLPTGVNSNASDVVVSNDSVLSMIRGGFWATRGQSSLNGADLAQMSVHKDMKQRATIHYSLDAYAVGFDIAWAILSVLAPAKALADGVVKTAVQTLVKGGIKAFRDYVKKHPTETYVWAGIVLDTMDCVRGGIAKNLPKSFKDIFSTKSYEQAAGVVHGCLSSIMSAFHLDEALGDVFSGLLDNVKVIPEVIATTVAGIMPALTLGTVDLMHSSISIERFDPLTKFVGTWKSGETTLTIKSNKTATMRWLESECDGDCMGGGTFKVYGYADLKASLRNGKLTLTYKSTRYLENDKAISVGDPGEFGPVANDSQEILSFNSSGKLVRQPVRHNLSDDGMKYFIYDKVFTKQK